MKIIKKEFEREFVSNEIIVDTLTVTVEVDNKQHNIVIDNQSNFSQEKYQFKTSEYMNDDIDADILEQFENSDFYNELCDFAESEAIARDDEQESDIIDEINENFEIHKKDNNFYNNNHLTIFKNKQENSLVDFILRVKRIVNNSLEQSFYEISASDFDQDEDEVNLNESYDYDCNNQIHYSHQIN